MSPQRSTTRSQRENMPVSLYTANAKCLQRQRITVRSKPREAVLVPGCTALTSSKAAFFRVCSVRVGPGVPVNGSAATLEKFRSDSKQLPNPTGLVGFQCGCLPVAYATKQAYVA